MSSHSIRVSADLFEQAQRQGEALSRSAAQQVEHWARLGAAVEASGLSVPELIDVLRGELPCKGPAHSSLSAQTATEAQLWAHKRAQQRRDMASIAAGRSTQEAMSWFSGGRARRAKAVKSPL